MHPEARKIFKSFTVPLLLSLLMIGVKVFEVLSHTDLGVYGVLPRQISGLKGILFIPFLHADWEHLFSNVIPLLVTGSMLFYFYREMAVKVILLIYILSGFWLWLGGRENYHIGASNIVYGITAFLFLSGFIRKHTGLIAVSLLMVFLYGSLVWGLFPVVPKISWEGHLFGALSGILCAIVFRKEGQQQEVYEWGDDDETFDNHENDENAPQSSLKIVYSYKKSDEQNGTEES